LNGSVVLIPSRYFPQWRRKEKRTHPQAAEVITVKQESGIDQQ
jgi:hypothetical protein